MYPSLDETELVGSIVDQLQELESDLALCRHSIIDSTRPEIQTVVRYLQVAHLVIGYNRLSNLLRPYGYSIHRLGLDGSDAVVTGYCGVIDTSKGQLIF